MAFINCLNNSIKGLLLDINGCIKDGDVPISGSAEAVKRLQSLNIPFRLISNDSVRLQTDTLNALKTLGISVTRNDLFTPVPAVIEILKQENLRPHLLLHPRMLAEFTEIDKNDPNCVVIGDAVEYFNYNSLNECFKKLMTMEKPILFTLGKGKYYLLNDGYALDAGPFVKGLEYATGVNARLIGKPNSEYFLSAVNNLGLQPHEVVMIGDDIEGDIEGAQACGMNAILVRTGKYIKERDEPHKRIIPNGIVDNLEEAVNLIIKHLEQGSCLK